MVPISVCIIMKNEEQHIANCLSALQKFGFGSTTIGDSSKEIIVVDTGSSDNSVAIANQYTEKVFFFKWIQDFAAAKNFAISKATNDYVLIIDADEYLTSIDFDCLYTSIKKNPNAIGQLLRHNQIEENQIKSIYKDKVERLFNRNYFHFVGSIHEQVHPIHNTPLEYYEIPIIIDHAGYNQSAEELKKKADRNNELLFKELEKDPSNPYLYFQIAQSYMLLRDFSGALEWYEKGLAFDVDPSLEYVQMMVIGYGECLLSLERQEDALCLTNIYDNFSFAPDFVFLIGQIYMQNQMYIKAYSEFLKCLNMSGARSEGVTSFYSYHNIGVINEALGNKEMAIEFYRKAGNYPRSVSRLEELLNS